MVKQPSEEQQGLRNNRSTVDAIFIVKQIVEESIEYYKLAPKASERAKQNYVLPTQHKSQKVVTN